MEKTQTKIQKRNKRHNRIRSKISGTSKRPRLSVFKSNKYIRAQIIDDTKGSTLVTSTSEKIAGKNFNEKSKNVGLDIAHKAKAKKINSVVFDRGGYIFTGNVKTLADGAREGGLRF